MEKLSFEDGKYQLIFDAGKFTALRHGQPWRDLTGDKLVYVMFAGIQGLQATQALDTARLDFMQSQPEMSLRYRKRRWAFVGFTNYEYPTFPNTREAIDAAIAAQQGEKT